MNQAFLFRDSDENYKTVSYPVQWQRGLSADNGLTFKVDILRLFQGQYSIDMSKLSNVKFDRNDARRLAENYAGMISPAKP